MLWALPFFKWNTALHDEEDHAPSAHSFWLRSDAACAVMMIHLKRCFAWIRSHTFGGKPSSTTQAPKDRIHKTPIYMIYRLSYAVLAQTTWPASPSAADSLFSIYGVNNSGGRPFRLIIFCGPHCARCAVWSPCHICLIIWTFIVGAVNPVNWQTHTESTHTRTYTRSTLFGAEDCGYIIYNSRRKRHKDGPEKQQPKYLSPTRWARCGMYLKVINIYTCREGIILQHK